MTTEFRHIKVFLIAIAAICMSGLVVAQDPIVIDLDSLVTDSVPVVNYDSVNIGYGTSSPYVLGGAISTLSTGLTDISRLSPLENLQGRIAGATVVTTNGQPGGEISMLIFYRIATLPLLRSVRCQQVLM